jgi:hypothetical protein
MVLLLGIYTPGSSRLFLYRDACMGTDAPTLDPNAFPFQ